VLKVPLLPVNSMLRVPNKPGLGIELNMTEVKALRKK
jgi:L-alanine-DL-glutamate epimerase-like enolase superfamily enzyme